MKLSIELMATNLVLLVVLWIVAFKGMIVTASVLLALMVVVRCWSISAARKERVAYIAEMKAKFRTMIDRKFKDKS